MSTARSSDAEGHAAEDHVDVPARYRLDVTAGPQRGAHVSLDARGRTTIGADGADVVLLDPRVGELTLSVTPGAAGLLVEASGEGARRDGEALVPGAPAAHADGALYTLGGTAFTLVAEREAATGGAAAATSIGLDGPGVPPSSPRTASRDGDAIRGDEASANLLLPKVMGGLAALLLVAIGVSWLLHRDASPTEPRREATASRAPAPAAAAPDPAALLREAGFESVAFAATPDAPGRVSGYVESRARLLELQRVLRGVTPRPRIDVHVQQAVVEGVRDFFRTNGLLADVESTGPGTVRVVTTESDAPDTARLMSAVRQDVPGLRSLAAVNEPPVAVPTVPDAVPAPPTSSDAPGKRVVAVVQGDPSYVVTEDDSRYFIGSSLPTGHTIAGIEDEAVLLDWQGTKTRLEF